MTARSTNDQPKRGRPPNPTTRNALLAAGLAAFHRRGYNATGVADITDAVGVPKGSFYAQFDSKQAFGSEIVDAWTRDVIATADKHLRSGGPALTRLRSYFGERAARHEKAGCKRGCMFGNFGLELSDHDEVIAERVATGYRLLTDRLAACIAEGQRAGDIRRDRTAKQLGRLLVSGWEGALVSMRIHQQISPVREFIDVVLDELLK